MAKRKRTRFEQHLVGPVEQAHGRVKKLRNNLRKKPSARRQIYKPLDRYWPDLQYEDGAGWLFPPVNSRRFFSIFAFDYPTRSPRYDVGHEPRTFRAPAPDPRHSRARARQAVRGL